MDVRNISTTIITMAKPNISNDQMKDELTGIMRSIRKLPPKAEDNFAINETDIISNVFDVCLLLLLWWAGSLVVFRFWWADLEYPI